MTLKSIILASQPMTPFPKSWDATELACLNESCKIHKIIYCIKILNSDKFILKFQRKTYNFVNCILNYYSETQMNAAISVSRLLSRKEIT